jgi:hypothetical protein
MQLREISIRSLRYIPLETALTSREKELKATSLVNEFVDMVPSLRRLRASELICKHKPLEDGLHLEFCVLESAQMSLLNWTNRSSTKVSPVDSEFRSDLKMIQEDLTRIPHYIVESLTSGTDLLAILDSGEHGAKMRVIRKSVRNGSNLHALIQPELVGLNGQLPSHLLSLGQEVSIRAQVHDIKKSFARLKNFSFIGDVPSAVLNAEFGKFIELLRPKFHRNEVLNTLLLRALDGGEVLEFKTIAAFRWRDGQPVYFELKSAFDAFK